jgi:hypothetical protein
MFSKRAALFAMALPALAAATPALAAHGVTPMPIPAGYNFPQTFDTVEGWIKNNNNTAIRAHGWDLWAGISAPSGQDDWPILETWNDTQEVFGTGGNTDLLVKLSKTPRAIDQTFEVPRQFFDSHSKLMTLLSKSTAAFPMAIDNHFDPAFVAFVGAPHPGPGKTGASYYYNSLASLKKLNASWPVGTSGADRGIVEFSPGAVETKPVYSVVKAGSGATAPLTPIPLWQFTGPQSSGTSQPWSPSPNTWKTCVLIDPSPGASGRVRPATDAEKKRAIVLPGGALSCDPADYYYGPLSSLYHFPLTAAQAGYFNTTYHLAQTKLKVKKGDYAVLLAMHLNSKEAPQWTWHTYYWQPLGVIESYYPGTRSDMPGEVKGAWRNYAMCANYSQTTTYGGSTMAVCFNPYLETGLGDGIDSTASNCISCHGIAGMKAKDYPKTYTKPIDLFNDPTYFDKTQTHTDFSWAVPFASK